MSWSKKISFLLIFFIIPLPFLGLLLGGWYTYLVFFLVFFAVPLVDYWVRDSANPDFTTEKILLHESYFRNIMLAYVPVQAVFLITCLYIASTVSLSWYEWVGFCLSAGLITGGAGITIAHEFMHKNAPFQQWMSKILLVMVCYGHFLIEHVRGHHVRVATLQDPASARLGESVYRFIPRSIGSSFISAWRLEQSRLKQKELSPFGIHNQFWWIIILPIMIALCCAWLGGYAAVLFFLGQSIVAVLSLELVNYIEHYGLIRQKLPNGQYERVSPCHSWNANHWLSNILLFHLQRHSDHHTYGARPYQILRHMEESPQLPSGYLGMMFLALFPPLWRAVMDKRALAYRNNQPV